MTRPSNVPFDETCAFCQMAAEPDASVVLETETVLAFLDHRPLFHGHVLVIPRRHTPTFGDLEPGLLSSLFDTVHQVSEAVEQAMKAEGTFIAINNKVSQSVPHLHIHVVPRRRKDGLRGFFWPRHPYETEDQMAETAKRIRAQLSQV